MIRIEDRDSPDLLTHYLQEIRRIPRITAERERELALRIRDNDTAAIEELVRANLRFVVSYAKRYRNPQVSFLDLINEGNIGLMQAAKKFDPDKNVRFISYAVWWVRQCILHALSEQTGSFRLPQKRASLMFRLERAIGASVIEKNHIPTAEELATQFGVSVSEVQTLMQANNDGLSLDSEMGGEGSDLQLGEMVEQTSVPSVEVELQEQSRREELLEKMKVLGPKELLVLSLRHGVTDSLPMTKGAIADFLGRSLDEVDGALRSATATLCGRLRVGEGELATLVLFTNSNSRSAHRFWSELPDRDESVRPGIEPARLPQLESLKRDGLVQRAIEELPLHQRTVFRLRYGILQEELTLRDIGEILGLSRERVRQIELRAEQKCRRAGRGRNPLRNLKGSR